MKLEISTSRLLYETLRKQALYVIKLLLYSGMQLQAHMSLRQGTQGQPETRGSTGLANNLASCQMLFKLFWPRTRVVNLFEGVRPSCGHFSENFYCVRTGTILLINQVIPLCQF